MMQKNIGYPLPSGSAYTDEMACLMLFYPDKAEYRQALMSAYFYFGNWLAWEKESDKKGKDAALAWKEAIEVTMGCIEMNTCETILNLLAEIRDNTGIYCCDAVDITDGDQYTDEVEDGVGDVPQNIIDAGYATGASDWDGFYDYKCMVSHVMVDNLKAQLETILNAIDQSGAILVGVVALAAIAVTILTAGGALLATGIVLSLIGVAGLSAALTEIGEAALPDLIDAVDDNHDALACAIYNADGSANAVTALKDEIDNQFTGVQAAVLQNLNIPASLKALYAGRYDQQDIAQNLADLGYDVLDYDCTCPPAEYSYLAEYDSDEEEWDVALCYGYTPVGNPAGGLHVLYSGQIARITNSGLRTGHGVGGSGSIEIVAVTFDVRRETSSQPHTAVLTFDPADANEVVKETGLSVGWNTDISLQPAAPLTVIWNDFALYLGNEGGVAGGSTYDNVRVWFNVL